ncbi:NAD-dependent epimerase/dehydratase family protein [Roseococcus pinisoli]|uniref:NAD(P)-dependent oxidoreductase n=1 Tax=Roseococcus pinisoli TaxID=2835040 RepID=A0ABS5QDG0_9PROT|nr:NAD(P)-dependent oxidoreductase [Roseococcus pinisoli]MBS7811741.1 NAD(P)-dependent oxidoreductase [Roseococcus pinisoli]
MTRRVLVLGAGGFVGRHVMAGLPTAGFDVIAGVRGAAPPGIEARRLEATDQTSLRAALDGVTDIVNCVAAAPGAMTQATQALCEVARERRIVHLSSMAVYGAATGLVNEEASLPGGGPYADGKVASEGILRQHAANGGQAVILRPGCIHGPGSEQWTARPARLLRQGRLGDLGVAGDGFCNLTAVADLVAAIAAALERSEISGAAFNIADPEPGRWNDYFLHLALAIGATPLRRLPDWQMKLDKLAAFPLKAAEIMGGKLRIRFPDPIPPSLWRVFAQEIRLDHRRADAELGFLRQAPKATLAEAAEWFLRAA